MLLNFQTLAEVKIGTYDNVATVTKHDTMLHVLEKIIEQKVTALPVVDGDGKCCIMYSVTYLCSGSYSASFTVPQLNNVVSLTASQWPVLCWHGAFLQAFWFFTLFLVFFTRFKRFAYPSTGDLQPTLVKSELKSAFC